MDLQTVRAGPRGDAETGSQNAMRSGLPVLNIADSQRKQEQTASVGPSPEAVAEAEEFLLDEIYRDLDLIRSYATSALEACRRGDREELRLRLRSQLHDCFRHAVEVHNLLSTGRKVASEAGRAAA